MSNFVISSHPSSWMRWWRKQRISFVSEQNHHQSHLKWRHLEIQRRASSVSGDWTAMQPWSWEQSSVWRNIEAASSLCHFTSRWWIQCSPFHVTYTASLTILKASCWHQLLTTEQKTFCNWELLSEFIDSPIDKQIYSNWELSSEHIDSIYFLVSLATVAMVKFNQLMEIIPYY